jgi:hypothetical protein
MILPVGGHQMVKHVVLRLPALCVLLCRFSPDVVSSLIDDPVNGCNEALAITGRSLKRGRLSASHRLE